MKSKWTTGVLVLLVLVTAIASVYVRHQGRTTFMDLQQAEKERDELATDWGRLQLEYATLAEGNRVERVARDELGLSEAQSNQVMVIVK